jgi:hypothetical protein
MSTHLVVIDDETRYGRVLLDFLRYLQQPGGEHLRFWQALRNWSKYDFIRAVEVHLGFNYPQYTESRDTFHWEGKRHDSNR